MKGKHSSATYYDGVVDSSTDLDAIAHISKKNSKKLGNSEKRKQVQANYIVDRKAYIYRYADGKRDSSNDASTRRSTSGSSWKKYRKATNFSFTDVFSGKEYVVDVKAKSVTEKKCEAASIKPVACSSAKLISDVCSEICSSSSSDGPQFSSSESCDCVGAAGPAGPVGPTGATGPEFLNINNTVFVDAQFGDDGTGLPEDMAAPFQTLTAGLAQAITSQGPGETWTVYVWPGIYTDDNMTLINGVGFYFTEGAIVQPGSANPIFIVSAPDVVTDIKGDGNFINSGGVLNLIASRSIIVFEATTIASDVNPAFRLNNPSQAALDVSRIQIDILKTEIIDPPNETLVAISGSMNVKFNVVELYTTQLYSIAATGVGAAEFSAQYAQLGVTDSDRTGMENFSQTFDALSEIQNLDYLGTGYVVTVDVPAPPIDIAVTSLTAQKVTTFGGVATITTATSLADTALRASIDLVVERIRVFDSGSATTSFFASNGTMFINTDVYNNYNTNDAVFCLDVQDGGTIIAEFGVFSTDVMPALNADNVPGSTLLSIMNVSTNYLNFFEILSRQNNFTEVTINSDNILSSSSTTTTEAVIVDGDPAPGATNGTLAINSTVMQLFGNGASILAYLPIIDIRFGRANITVGNYLYFGNFAYAIQTAPNLGGNFIDIQQTAGFSDNTTFLHSSGQTSVIVGLLFMLGAVNNTAILVYGGAQLFCDITTMGASGADALSYGINVTDDSTVIGTISAINSNGAPAIQSTSTGNVQLVFESITTEMGIACLNFLGPGDVRLTGGTINTRNTVDGIVVAGATELSLVVSNIIGGIGFGVSSVQSVIRINAPGGGCFIDYQGLNVGPDSAGDDGVSVAAIWCSAGIISIQGLTTVVNGTCILVDGDATFLGKFASIAALRGPGALAEQDAVVVSDTALFASTSDLVAATRYVLNATTSGRMRFIAGAASNATTDAPIFLEPTVDPGDTYTVGGEIRTLLGTNAIENGPASTLNILRLMSSMLISLGPAIVTPALTPLVIYAVPFTVKFLPVLPVTIEPPLAIFDSAVIT